VLATEVISVANLTGHCDDAAVFVLRHDGNFGHASPAGGDGVAPFVRGGG
jgi:hypothetical protein